MVENLEISPEWIVSSSVWVAARAGRIRRLDSTSVVFWIYRDRRGFVLQNGLVIQLMEVALALGCRRVTRLSLYTPVR